METEKQLISHLYQNKENGKWIIQTNDEHQRGVAEMATSYSGLFGLPSWGHTLGMLHDKGKERDAFQQYIRTTSGLPVTDEKSYGEHHHAFVGGILVTNGSPDKPGGLSIQLCKSEKKEFYIRYSS